MICRVCNGGGVACTRVALSEDSDECGEAEDCRACGGAGVEMCGCEESPATVRDTDWFGKPLNSCATCADEMATLRRLVGTMSADEDVARVQREVAVAKLMDLRSN